MSGQHPNPQEPTEPRADGPLPPIPDGGLALAMPDWLREGTPSTGPAQPSGSNDPSGFLTEDDLPIWLRHLSPEGAPLMPPRPETPVERVAAQPGPARPTPPRQPAQIPMPPSHPPVPERPPAVVPTPLARPEPQPPDRRTLVGIIGFAVLALGVLAYLYARGLL